MKLGIVTIMVLVLVVACAFASVAQAGSSTTAQIILDASDGRVDGNYTVAQVRAALAEVNSDPAYSQYSDVAGVLQAYLTSLSSTGSASSTPTPTPMATVGATATASAKPSGGQLASTGGQTLVAFALGGALIVAGVALIRRRA